MSSPWPCLASPAIGKAQYEDKDMAQRVAALEYKLQYVTGGADEVVITGQTYALSMAWEPQTLPMGWAT